MKSVCKRLLPTLTRYRRIPTELLLADVAIAAVLSILAIYHFTQPDQAWRSGSMELFCVALLLTAAYLVSPMKAAAIHLLVAVFAVTLGSYHLTHGGGWKSGIAELLFAAFFIAAAFIIFHDNKERS